MTKHSKSLFSSANASLEYNATENITDYNESQNDNTFPDNWNNYFYMISIIMFPIGLSGLAGNGIIIWLLGFRIKRTPFTTYILNLAIADFGVLTSEIISEIVSLFRLINLKLLLYLFFFYYAIFLFTFTASHFLMTIISIDRCVCLFFPLWHRCHRPPRLSTSLCVIAWILSFLTTATSVTLLFAEYAIVTYLQFFLNAVVCMPIMCVSTTAMFIKFCLRPAQKKKGRLFRTIWLTLFFFLLFGFPINIINILSVSHFQTKHSYGYGYISVCLNSAINPMIYYLLGRDKRGRFGNRINKVLEKLFKEKEDYTENQEI